jgi:glycosyltransferase involved in cell wall biosynthesis
MYGVSIIVACYNSARFLAQTIASVQAQTRTDWELILIDDGSRDQTGEMITAWARDDSRIKAILKSNEGACRTRNVGFQAAHTKSSYLFFLDHDDCIEPDFLEKMCGHLETNPEVGLAACQFEDIAEDGTKLGTGGACRWRPGWLFPHRMRDEEIETPFATFFSRMARGPFAVYRRSVYEQTTGWETSFWPDEDTDMFCQMALLAKVHFLPNRLYLKRVIAGQGSQDKGLVDGSYLKFREKWDHRVPRDAKEKALLLEANRFFYRRYFPMLDFHSALRAAKRRFKPA